MPKTFIIGSEEFEFPVTGENPEWGSNVTDWAEAVSDALTSVQQPNDILETTAIINNNQLTFTNIPGFSFTTTQVQYISCEYFITRSTTSPASVVAESGVIRGHYNGSAWSITQQTEEDAGVTFNVSPSGQFQYISTNIVGSGYAGTITFKAKVINQ